jgi:putative serine protease PepD
MGTAVTAAAGGAVTTVLLLASGALQTRGGPALGDPPLAARGLMVAAAPGGLSARDIYRLAAPAVVSVHARVVRAEPSPFAPGTAPAGVSAGSGFVIDDDRGLVITNAHTVAAASQVTVTLADGRARPARTLGRDDDTDLALLAIDPDGLDLHALELGDSAGVEVGDPTLSLGDPAGGAPTLTTGVVSAASRRLTSDGGFAVDAVIQTDAPQPAGATGGPLLDAGGHVVGVTSQLMVGGVPVGFAVPAETVADVVPQLEEAGRVRRAFLGILGESLGGGAGVRVAAVRGGSPAARAGLRAGEVVRALDGAPVRSMDDLCRVLADHRPGEEVTVSATRDGRRTTRAVTLAERPAGVADR